MTTPTTRTHPDLAALRRAVLIDPADDLRRLVYADCLEEQGEVERAEFVRVQVELATLPVERAGGLMTWSSVDAEADAMRADDPTRERLRRREGQLFTDSGPLWWDDLPGQWRATVLKDTHVETAEGWRYDIRRGLVSAIACPLAAYLEHAAALFGAHPIERVMLSDQSPAWVDRDPGFHCWTWATSGVPAWLMPLDRWSPTSAAAEVALSPVLVAHGRALAHLPPLPLP